jgi:hypothetical protein
MEKAGVKIRVKGAKMRMARAKQKKALIRAVESLGEAEEVEAAAAQGNGEIQNREAVADGRVSWR